MHDFANQSYWLKKFNINYYYYNYINTNDYINIKMQKTPKRYGGKKKKLKNQENDVPHHHIH